MRSRACLCFHCLLTCADCPKHTYYSGNALSPSQVFPTDVRAFFHGISAAAGKLGAILAASIFSQVRHNALQ